MAEIASPVNQGGLVGWLLMTDLFLSLLKRCAPLWGAKRARDDME